MWTTSILMSVGETTNEVRSPYPRTMKSIYSSGGMGGCTIDSPVSSITTSAAPSDTRDQVRTLIGHRAQGEELWICCQSTTLKHQQTIAEDLADVDPAAVGAHGEARGHGSPQRGAPQRLARDQINGLDLVVLGFFVG